MSLSGIFGSRKSRAERALQERVTALQAELNRYKGLAKRSTQARREFMGAIAVIFLALGFALGVYREPVLQTAGDLAANLGIYCDTANAADHRSDSAMTQMRSRAEAGDARAQSELALIYYRGRGVTEDYKEAVKWFRRAADQRDARAEFYLGIMFADGQGVPQNRAEAAKWFRFAADSGNAEAQYNLGLAYATGEGVPLDNVRAHMWFNLAATAFAESDTSRYSIAARNRDLVAGKLTSGQIAEAERLALEWQP